VASAPDLLTPRQRAIVAIAALVCAASRFLALARTLWEWDEAMFTLAMRDYDVTLHHPHPPGFPAYIFLGRIARFVTGSDFHALRLVNLIAAMLVFPAIFFLARELRLRFETSLVAAMLFAFFPNVWYFGGGAFSDVPSIVLVCFAATMLLRGARDRNAYWLGTLLLAVAIGIRPQNLLLGLFPGMYATYRRRPREIVVALVIGIVIVAVCFGGAAYATGSLHEYIRMVRQHSDYIARVDSFRSPARPALWRMFIHFFVQQYQSLPLSIIATLLAIVSIVRAIRERDVRLLYTVLTFAPFAFLAWLMLDRFSVSRFSIGYQPMFAILVADGIHRLARWRRWIEPLLASALLVAFVAFTAPALKVVRTTIAPTVLAARAVNEHLDPAKDLLYVGGTMVPFVDLFSPSMRNIHVLDDRALPLAWQPRTWLIAELTRTEPDGFVFTRPRNSLWKIARHNYFEVVLKPVRERAQFLSGWYAPESSEHDEWRWMTGRSVTLLPPRNGPMVLRMHLGVPGELMDKNPEITVKLNGRIVDRFRTTEGYFERNVHVLPAPNGAPNVLELSIDHILTPPPAQAGSDGRTLGLRLRYLAWGPA
jgi:4-amino-4-deoxy-L-arabinose transferase-like glycosyltransferase